MKNANATRTAGSAGVAVRRVGTPADQAGLCGILGGTLRFVSGVLGMVLSQLNEPDTTVFQVRGVVATVSLVLLLVGLYPLVGELGTVILLGQPSLLLNAAWGIFGALLGYAVLSQGRDDTLKEARS